MQPWYIVFFTVEKCIQSQDSENTVYGFKMLVSNDEYRTEDLVIKQNWATLKLYFKMGRS